MQYSTVQYNTPKKQGEQTRSTTHLFIPNRKLPLRLRIILRKPFEPAHRFGLQDGGQEFDVRFGIFVSGLRQIFSSWCREFSSNANKGEGGGATLRRLWYHPGEPRGSGSARCAFRPACLRRICRSLGKGWGKHEHFSFKCRIRWFWRWRGGGEGGLVDDGAL